jgi:hypothetical protein
MNLLNRSPQDGRDKTIGIKATTQGAFGCLMRGAWLGSASQAESGQAEDMHDMMFG